ncbi:MAG: cytochrome c oxidase assembly protein subunit 15 [Myxococcota bacterium]
MNHAPAANRGFIRYAYAVLVYDLFVILWGAWVRVTGSGAGCGDHWPSCNGEVIPRTFTTERIIEFTHRVTSGLSIPISFALVVWAFRIFPKGHRVRKATVVAILFLLAEAAIGALIVKRELVNDNASIHRAVVMAIHLVNTFGLVAAAVLAAWWARPARPAADGEPGIGKWLLLSMGLLLLTGITGAITALGDTLFPADVHLGAGMFERIAADLSPTMHFLIRLRIVHPAVAIITALLLASVLVNAIGKRDAPPIMRSMARYALAFVGIQVCAGLINVWLAAPGWMQLIHLLLSDVLWIFVVLTWDSSRRVTARL